MTIFIFQQVNNKISFFSFFIDYDDKFLVECRFSLGDNEKIVNLCDSYQHVKKRQGKERKV